MSDSVETHTYENALVLVGVPMMSLESAAFTFLVPAGSCRDPKERSGLGALTCEMSLRGAGSRDSRTFVSDLENLGVQQSESVSNIHTNFSGACLAKNLPAALQIYADLLRRPLLPEDQLEASRLVVMQELLAIEDDPSQKLKQELYRRYYPDPWGRPSHGEQAAIEAITMEEIREAFQRNYQPNGIILGVAGRFDWQSLKEHVGQLFGDWKPLDVPEPDIAAPTVLYEHLHHDLDQTHIGIAFTSVPYRHEDYFQAWGAVGVLSSGSSSRLFTEVREKRGLCYSVGAHQNSLRDLGSVFCYAGTSAERAQATLDVMLAELTKLSRGIEPFELDRLKARIKSALIMQQESSLGRSSSIAREWYHRDHVRTLSEIGQLIDQLSSESINAYLTKHPPGDFTIVTLGPKALEIPGGIS